MTCTGELLLLKPLCIPYVIEAVREWSLITGRGGGYKMERGHMNVYPYEKGGGRKSFSHAEGGHTKFWGSFYMSACRF